MTLRLVDDTMPPDDFFEDGAPRSASNDVAPAEPPCAKLLESVPPEWCTTVPPNRKWLLRDDRRPGAPGLLPLGKAGMVIGEGGISKTTALCQLAIAIATGEPFLDWFTVASPGRVFFAAGEEDREDMWRKIYSAAQARGSRIKEGMIEILPLAGIPCALLEPDERGLPQETMFTQWLLGHLRGEKYSLIILDPLSRFAGPLAEKDNAVATRFVQIPERIASTTGATVLTSHHTAQWSRDGKEVTATASRGSTAFTDGHRWVASLSVVDVKKKLEDESQRDRLGEVVTLSFVKSNYSKKADPIQLRRNDHGALVPIDSDEASAVDRARSGAAQREAKAAADEGKRETKIQVRERQEADRRAARATAKEELLRQRDHDDDHAARAIMAAHPTDTAVRVLVPFLTKARACGGTRAHAALVRVRGVTS